MSRRLVKSGSAADRPALVTLINFSLFSSHVSCDPPGGVVLLDLAPGPLP
jgi:hypothetical protein